jgi:hypothetical protein
MHAPRLNVLTQEEVRRLVQGGSAKEPRAIDEPYPEGTIQCIAPDLATKEPKNSKHLIVRGVALCLSLTSSIASIYYSFMWFYDKQPIPLAAITSIVIVACLTLGPELAILLIKRGQWNIIGALAVLAITAACAVFSMSSTIGGLYNARSEKLSIGTLSMARQSGVLAELRSLEEEQARTRASIKKYENDETMYQAVIDAQGDPMSRPAQDAIRKRDAARNLLTIANQKLERADKRIVALSGEEAVQASKRDNFYLFLAGRLGSTEDVIEFSLSAFPAIFFDVLAPAMLYVAMNL